MHLRTATIEDLATLRRWDGKAHVIAATGADDAYPWADELPRNIAWRELLIGEGRDPAVVCRRVGRVRSVRRALRARCWPEGRRKHFRGKTEK